MDAVVGERARVPAAGYRARGGAELAHRRRGRPRDRGAVAELTEEVVSQHFGPAAVCAHVVVKPAETSSTVASKIRTGTLYSSWLLPAPISPCALSPQHHS